MDELLQMPLIRQPSRWMAVVALALLLPGCAWLKGQQQAKRDLPPVRDSDAPGKVSIASDDHPSAQVALDGSAEDQGSPATPNAPGIASKGAPLNGISNPNLANTKLDHPTAGRWKGEDSPNGTGNSAATGSGELVATNSATDAGGTSGVTTADMSEEGALRPSQDPAPRSESTASLPGSFDIAGDGVKIEEGIAVATVNGQPIFLDDVLRDLPKQYLEQAKKQLPPEKFDEWLKAQMQPRLEPLIDEELLIQAIKIKLKPEQIKDISKQIDAHFNKEDLPAVMKKAGYANEVEYDKFLRTIGTSVETLRSNNRRRQMAQQYIGYMNQKIMPKATYDRPDLLKYYNEHKSDFKIPGKANWQQIRLDFDRHGGQEKTCELAELIKQRLESGEDFGELAKEYSNGPTAKTKAGVRGWTTRGMLADEAVDQALFTLEVNEISSLLESKSGIDIIRVLDRSEDQYKPFSAVQEDIKTLLKDSDSSKAVRQLIDDLRSDANIIRLNEDEK